MLQSAVVPKRAYSTVIWTFWMLHCRSLESNVFHRCGPAIVKCCVTVEQHTLLCRSSGVGACWRQRWAHSHQPDTSVHCWIDTGRPGQRPWIGTRCRTGNQCSCHRIGVMWFVFQPCKQLFPWDLIWLSALTWLQQVIIIRWNKMKGM